MECYYCKGSGKNTDKKEVEWIYKHEKMNPVPEWRKQLIEMCPYCHGGGKSEVYNKDGSFKGEGYWDQR